jgi:uncharacterized iron-regulated membrane protein
MRLWRKTHMFSFGYFKAVSLITSTLLLVIALTGILYNHQHDFDFLRNARISTSLLPDSYQARLDDVRAAQGFGNLFPEEAHNVPIMWVVIDLHNGSFFGGFGGQLLYDAIALSLTVLSVSGIVMYFRIRKRVRF